MTDARHSKQTIADGIHGIVAYEYANEAARLAATGFTSEDFYRVAIEQDTSDLYILIAVSPPTWIYFGNVSQELNKVRVPCRKNSPGTLSKGTVVYATDYNDAGDYALVEAAKADSASTLPAAGIIEEECTDSVTGYVLIVGVLCSCDTSSFSAKDPIYVSHTVAGEIVNVAPPGPYITQPVGAVLSSHPTTGRIGVNVLSYRAYNYVSTPQPLGVAAAGTSNLASPSDHVHGLPKLDNLNAPDDNTDLNATTSAHGLLPKLSDDSNQFLDGDGSWQTQVYGRESYSNSSWGENNTSSTSPVQKLRLTTPALEGGNYEIKWSYESVGANLNDDIKQRIEIDDTIEIMANHQESNSKYSDDQWRHHAGFWYGAMSATIHNIDLDHWSPSGETSYIRRARISIKRVS